MPIESNWTDYMKSGRETVTINYDRTKAIKTRFFRDSKLSSLLSLVQD